jgi:uncharacterized protein (DUF849 family)
MDNQQVEGVLWTLVHFSIANHLSTHVLKALKNGMNRAIGLENSCWDDKNAFSPRG